MGNRPPANAPEFIAQVVRILDKIETLFEAEDVSLGVAVSVGLSILGRAITHPHVHEVMGTEKTGIMRTFVGCMTDHVAVANVAPAPAAPPSPDLNSRKDLN